MQKKYNCKWLFKWYNVKPFKPINLNTALGVASENKNEKSSSN